MHTADRIPASRFLTEALEKSANRNGKSFNDYDSAVSASVVTTTEMNNPFAAEINGGLIISTSFPFFQDDSVEQANSKSSEYSNYFSVDWPDSVERINLAKKNPYEPGYYKVYLIDHFW